MVLLSILVLGVLDSQTRVWFLTVGLLHILLHIGLRIHTKFVSVVSYLPIITTLILLLRLFASVVISLAEVVSRCHVCVGVTLLTIYTICGESVSLSELLLLLGCDTL